VTPPPHESVMVIVGLTSPLASAASIAVCNCPAEYKVSLKLTTPFVGTKRASSSSRVGRILGDGSFERSRLERRPLPSNFPPIFLIQLRNMLTGMIAPEKDVSGIVSIGQHNDLQQRASRWTRRNG
jgi:hypothetical protein